MPHEALFDLHQQSVRVTDEERQQLGRARDLNVQRLLDGLDLLGVDRPISHTGQGGYSMHTLTQRDDNDQDLDVALIFDTASLPASALAARDLVHDAVMATAPDGFYRPPERRTNAVTMWYSAGYHIDFAVYRMHRGTLEHAGADWSRSDPRSIVEWFRVANSQLSPTWHPRAVVHDGQLRRIVRLLKWLRHGDDDTYPGGFVITALAVQHYRASSAGDDVALRSTMSEITAALRRRLDVRHPLDARRSLVPRAKDQARLARFLALLDTTLQLLGRATRPGVRAWGNALGIRL